MIFLDQLCEQEPATRQLTEGSRVLRVHRDVLDLAKLLVEEEAKLAAAAPFIFFPAIDSWIEWEDEQGKLGFYFHGKQESVTEGFGFLTVQRHDEDNPVMLPLSFDTPGYRLEANPAPSTTFQQRLTFGAAAVQVKPVVFAILALINSPKLIRQRPIDVSRINKKRASLGRYCFHPHHEVRLDVDKRIISTVSGSGDGTSRALHFVRTHLRFRRGQYELVRPHWRGDPAMGIRDASYRIDRKNSKWVDR